MKEALIIFVILGVSAAALDKPRQEPSAKEIEAEARVLLRDYLKGYIVLRQGCIFGDSEWKAVHHYRQSQLALLAYKGSESVPVLLDELRRAPKDPNVMSCVLRILYAVGAEGEQAVPVLLELLRTQQEDNLKGLLQVLGSIGPKAKTALSAVGPFLEHRDPEIRAAAARAVWRISGDVKRVLPVLRTLIKKDLEQQKWVVADALDTLGQIGPAAREALPEMRVLLRSEKYEVYTAAGIALVKVDPQGKAAIEMLLTWLRNENEIEAHNRLIAAVLLAQVEEHRKEALAVVELLMKEENSIRSETLHWIEGLPIDPPRKVLLLVKALKDRSPFVRQVAAMQLGELGVQAKSALTELRALEGDDDRYVRVQVAGAIRRITAR